ncbi:phage tail protein [Novosphingopyxis sp. YJ-S2-01]|uniref:phage tail protein n=1 Tax=Novosphingopyxis sp. YJ-S2-01 TaxID=2794021 RepID=UPI0018DB517E|nr:phage tail protein [Novosphingopyxis sp. YJ-S2-01]MBH9537912.1 phage tail protein [Novosphingopyxis sp. YJ-S2-01]
MLMSLGLYFFSISSLAHQDIVHRRSVRFARNERIGAPDAWQFLGPGPEVITLSGTTAFGVGAPEGGLATLNRMMQEGAAQPLVDGLGNVFGRYAILALDTKKTVLDRFGQARRNEWAMDLERVDDPGAAIGNLLFDKLAGAAPGLASLKGDALSIARIAKGLF